MDLVTRKVTRAGASLELTAREFWLLECLLRHQGHLVSREKLARDIWKKPAGRHTSATTSTSTSLACARKWTRTFR
jgi:DNA-binding response OmpR family regulator